MVVSKTASRPLLGSMNDFVHMLSLYPPGRPLLERALMLAESPCSPIGGSSETATVELFGKPQLRVVRMPAPRGRWNRRSSADCC